ncbi:methionyl-tRNA formyltransferase [Paenalcaligenes niemegkensis]|uniref:methionyl-tRNA formyltransferase n=1 Tax=Paenalcaligenes niemegkensis TaxID=2895469 RepID=UPI001EE8B8A8|nr:methionyl-tRNA formyltransferase [Paenalcaligenes niemegkensis]MCQ9617625.1 methionyl-tRNA formyltransferase [Paenalcaligenes niemegkensis]
MRIIFAGTPEFARQALVALLDAGHDVPLVMTQPDRPSGRGMKMRPSPVKQEALDREIPVSQPRSLRLEGKYPEDAAECQQLLTSLQADAMVVAAYGLILPAWVLELPKHGCLNIHASLLPRWRGAAPIQRAIDAGDTETGITIMQMDEGLDTGAMLWTRTLPISQSHTAALLHDELAELGAQSIVEALAKLEQNELRSTSQPAEGVTYAEKLAKSESPLDFSRSAGELARRIRAFNPVPGSTFELPGIDGQVKVWAASVLAHDATKEPGSIVAISADGIDVATGDGVLRILELQRPGSKRQPVSSFIAGWQAEL